MTCFITLTDDNGFGSDLVGPFDDTAAANAFVADIVTPHGGDIPKVHQVISATSPTDYAAYLKSLQCMTHREHDEYDTPTSNSIGVSLQENIQSLEEVIIHQETEGEAYERGVTSERKKFKAWGGGW